MKNLTKIIFSLCIFVLLQSCKPVRAMINNQFPPLSTTDQQYSSIEANFNELKDFNPHIGSSIDKDLILKYLPVEIKNEAESYADENFKIKNIELPKLSFDKQGIFSEADFTILSTKYDIEIRGKFSGVTAVSTKSDSLYLRNALSSLKIKSILFIKKPKIPRKAFAKLVTPLLKKYIENLNGQFLKKPTIVYAGWGDTYKLNFRKMFKDPSLEIIGDSTDISRFTKRSSIRIKPTGISIMVELTKEKPAMNLLPAIQTKKRTEAELTKIFQMFDQKYDQYWTSVFDPIDDRSLVVTNISKSEISNIFNDALSKPLIVKQKLTIPQISFNQKLEVKRGDIDCQNVRTNFSYPDFNGDTCNWSCMKRICIFGVCKKVEDPICASTRAACRVKRETARIAHQTARETARIAHQIENETKVASCNVWRETMDFLALGRFKGDISAEGNAAIYLKSFNFNFDLSELKLNYSGDVNASLKSNLEFKPVDLGHIFFCYTDYDKKFSSDVGINIPYSTSKISVTSTRDDNNLVLHIKPDKILYNASINPSPLHSLLLDPQFALKCPISKILNLVVIGTAAANFLEMVKLAPEQELLLLGKVNGSYGIDEMQIAFKPITFKINGERKESLIFWNAKSLQFKYLKP
ncbi:hypothetical protein HIO71_03240 [Chryseobacterium aquaticum]|uniref:Lipoprotein n=1 Tax=Chryseobacterium aquaticum TaxID=452084 RepID=A0A848N485_9FLAO|nr:MULTISPECIES: hypothetical protein [Chryseobacterium]NMR33219.1 hypothetical protein [Chryseobacterium aquaticum]NRQ44849.1 hypothetical protein [Chryseobacterium sp. C-204]